VYPGSEYEPPTNPYRTPGSRFQPPTQPPAGPPMPPMPPLPPMPPPRRRSWILPVVAAAVVVLLAGGVGAFYVYARTAATGPATGTGGHTSGTPLAGGTAPAPDTCAMLPKAEADRLVPDAEVAKGSRDADYAIELTCNWSNRRISFGEYWRSREIDVKIQQYRGDGAKTGRAVAQNSYDAEYGSAKYAETAKPTPEKGDKEYISPVKDIPGVGDSAYAQYTWRRSGTLLWYSFGQAEARVGDMTIAVRYQAGQQRKDAGILSNETAQSITEENAVREVTGLVAIFAKGVAAWQAGHPNVLAEPARKPVTTSPKPVPTPSPTNLAIFPPACAGVAAVAARLVPGGAQRGRGTEVGGDTQTECRWLNRDISGAGTKGLRSLLITTHLFQNRAGARDPAAARGFYAGERGRDGSTGGTTIGGLTWSEPADVKGLGEAAYSQYVQFRQGDVHNGSGTVVLRQGALVVKVDYAGADRPAGQPENSARAKLLPDRQARAGALSMARAYLAKLAEKPIGS
jgi:hypothetical protein